MRIVSLLPSATEMVCALGAQQDLVGISHECDFPAGLGGIPILTHARIGAAMTSRAIDDAVQRVVAAALAVYEIDVAELERVRPDVIVTQDLCDVCAVSLDDVRAAVSKLARQHVEIVTLRPTRLSDIWQDLVRIGEAIGRAARARSVAAELQTGIAELSARITGLPARPSVLTVEWLDPVMIGGLWMPELVAMAGGRALVTQPGQPALTLSAEELRLLDPDVVLLKPCGFRLERTLAELLRSPNLLPWNAWKAAAGGRVFASDGNAYFNRPGPRTLESLEILAACMHPELADLGEKHATSFMRIASVQA